MTTWQLDLYLAQRRPGAALFLNLWCLSVLMAASKADKE